MIKILNQRIVLLRYLFALLIILYINNLLAIYNIPSHYTVIYASEVINLALITPTNGNIITINTPGKYTIDKNLIFMPINNNTTGILIDSDNVILELNGYTITQNNNTANFTLINIAPGHTNVEISNGTLANCTGITLKIDTGTKITLDSLAINNSAATGIQLTNCNNSLITDTYITNCLTNNSSELSGIILNNCTNIKIAESASNNHINNAISGLVNGFKFINCSNCTISNCNSNSHQADRSNGYLIQTTDTCIFKNCKANNNLATQIIDTDGVAGFNLIKAVNCHLDSCQARSNSSKNFAYGFKLLNSQYNKVNNCTATHNSTSCSTNNAHAYGFYFNHNDGLICGNNIVSCQATGNTGGTNINSWGIGFALDGDAKYNKIYDCTADYNNSPIGTGCGIYINGATCCFIRNNKVIANTGNSPDGGYGIYDTAANSFNLYMQNFAFSNGKIDGTVINNYSVALAPENEITRFPSKIAYLNDFECLNFNKANNYNIEIIEKP